MNSQHLLPVLTLAFACGGTSTKSTVGTGGTGTNPSGGSGGSAGSSAAAAGGTSTAGSSTGGTSATGPMDPCATYGAMREASCGNCGTVNQTCASDGFWSDVGTCSAEGECAVGATEQSGAACAGEQRTCDSTCAWGDWLPIIAEPCTPGEVNYDRAACDVGQVERTTCNDGCEWLVEPCGDYCGGQARTSPADAVEVCVPEGPFIRGDEMAGATPVAEIEMSSYYLDKYPVTNRRYMACVQAGVCELIGEADTQGFEDYPVVTGDSYGPQWQRQFGEVFCEWDGGRKLATSAQWEKAARGPSPRTNRFLWGDTGCPSDWPPGCPALKTPYPNEAIAWRFDEFTAMPGYFGTEFMGFAQYEAVRDGFPSSYSDPELLRKDPVAPPGTASLARGSWMFGQPISYVSIVEEGTAMFRCVREMGQ